MDKLLNTSSQESRNICGVHSVQKFFSLLLTAFNFYCNLHMLERLRGEGGREFCLFLFCFGFCCISLPFSCFTLKKTGSSVKVHEPPWQCRVRTLLFISVEWALMAGNEGLMGCGEKQWWEVQMPEGPCCLCLQASTSGLTILNVFCSHGRKGIFRVETYFECLLLVWDYLQTTHLEFYRS